MKKDEVKALVAAKGEVYGETWYTVKVILPKTYKVVMDNLTCKSIDLTALPKETEKFYGLISNSVTVKSLDENIARVNFDKARRTIIIEAYGEGSTEIIVYARKGVSWTKKPVEQKISVTVNSIYDSVSTVS